MRIKHSMKLDQSNLDLARADLVVVMMGGCVRWVVFVGDLRLLEVSCVSGRIWQLACGSRLGVRPEEGF